MEETKNHEKNYNNKAAAHGPLAPHSSCVYLLFKGRIMLSFHNDEPAAAFILPFFVGISDLSKT